MICRTTVNSCGVAVTSMSSDSECGMIAYNNPHSAPRIRLVHFVIERDQSLLACTTDKRIAALFLQPILRVARVGTRPDHHTSCLRYGAYANHRHLAATIACAHTDLHMRHRGTRAQSPKVVLLELMLTRSCHGLYYITLVLADLAMVGPAGEQQNIFPCINSCYVHELIVCP